MNPGTEALRQMLRPSAAWVALLAALALVAMGIVAIGTAAPDVVVKQVQWLVIGLVLMLATMAVHPRTIGLAAGPMMAFTLALLVLLILPGVPRALVPTINGARCWINLYFMNFQPSELAKIVSVLVLARYLRYRENYRTLRGLLPPFLIVCLPVVLILKEPDLGSALLFTPALFFMLVAAGARLRHMGALLAIGVLAVALTVAAIYTLPPSVQGYILKPHQRDRIVAMIALTMGDESANQTINYQQDRAMTLVGSGGLHGYGARRSAAIVNLNQLPHDHNDMVFAVICNRWGFVGGITTMALYGVLIGAFLVAAGRMKDPFCRLATVGLAGFLFTQTTINIGQTLGLLPVTGITLPFVSYGGSSMVASFVMLGLVLNFAARRPAPLTRPSFEFGKAEAVVQ